MSRILACAISLGILASHLSLAQSGSATLSGRVEDIIAPVVGARIELRPEGAAAEVYRAKTDNSGTYRFLTVPKGTYTLKVDEPGYKRFTIASIGIAEGQERSLPVFRLSVGNVADCGGHAVVDHGRPLPEEGGVGDIRGSVRLDSRRPRKDDSLLEGVDVALLCSVRASCPSTKTDSKGEFVLKGLLPGNYYTLRFELTGFYPLDYPTYEVQASYELVYWPASLERCATRDCDPRRRPRKPQGHCE
jgi:hypothetical protein